MKITEITVKNFRCLRDIKMSMGDMTVIIGENNAGKTAVLDAIKLVLGRRWGLKGTGFTEYDFFMDDTVKDPKQSDGITVDLVFEESKTEEWPSSLVDELHEIIQTDPARDINSIILRASCKYNELVDGIDTEWTFLGRDEKSLTGKARRATNTHPFFQFVPVFPLSALRDASQEFSPRSQLWGQLLKKVDIPAEKWQGIESDLEALNAALLSADPKLSQIRDKIQDLKTVVSSDSAGAVDIRALPLKVWDLISRSEIVVRGRTHDPWLPLSRHGQGVQSLAVIYLFQAFVEHLLQDTYHKFAEPILLLEEPEAHLHPQGARALGPEIKKLSGQKLVTTHSPYFVERIPFKDLRVIRNCDDGAKVFSLRDFFKTQLPANKALDGLVKKYSVLLRYDMVKSELTVQGNIHEGLYRELLACYTAKEDRVAFHPRIKELREDSKNFMPQVDLQSLEIWARRIRGEIFFARVWLLVEGQTEHILLNVINELLGYPLDMHGVSIIDYQNNGAPGPFAALARSLGFPWLMTCDGDDAGENYIGQVKAREFDSADLQSRIKVLPAADIEQFLVENGFKNELVKVSKDLGESLGAEPSNDDLIESMRGRKVEYASALAAYLRQHGKRESHIPQYFKEINSILKELANE